MANPKLTPTAKELDELHPFGVPWLDSCYQETLLPNGPWQDKVYGLLCENLAQSISRHLDIPERRQIIFEMVGQEFTAKYFPDNMYSPHILDMMTVEGRRKLEADAQKWLYGAIRKAATATGCLCRSQAELNGEPYSEEMLDFVQHTKQIIQEGLDRHLFLKENDVIKRWEELEWKRRRAKIAEHEAREHERLRQEHDRLKGVLGVRQDSRGTLSADTWNESSVPVTSASRNAKTTSNVKGALFGSKEDPPLFWGIQSNTIGRSVMAILKRDPRRLAEVVSALHGRQLPGSLRSYVWLDILLKAERDKLQDSNTEKILRERFAKGVKRGLAELKIKSATHSPISGLIDTAVTQICSATPAMALYFKDNAYLREAAKALNILYVYDRVYEPYLINWLFPLQLAFQDGNGEADHAYELAMYLDLLNRNFLPQAPEIFAVAERAMSKVKASDPEFYNHLKNVAQINPTISPKEFLVHLIHRERSKAEELLAAKEGSKRLIEMSRELLTDPLIFLRKWLGEAFVGVLDTQAVIYIWDQLFMQRWTMGVAEDFCLVLLFLLRDKFLAARDYLTMKQVFLKEPCKLLTMDLQRAWIHVQEHRDVNEIPAMNRMMPRLGSHSATPRIAESSRSEATAVKPIDPVGVKVVEMELVLPGETLSKIPELSNLDPGRLRLLCSVCFGSIELHSKQSASLPVITSHEQQEHGGQKYVIALTDADFVFADLDLSNYDLEQEMGGFPKAVVRVDYSLEVQSTITLGWTEVGLHEKRERSALSPSLSSGRSVKWILLERDLFCALNSGQPPESTNENANYGNEYADLIGEGSKLRVVIYKPPRAASTLPRNMTPAARSLVDNVVTNKDPFDLYIDAITNIPDSASIIKVAGRVVRTGEVRDISDILALPEMASPSRNPRFTYRLVINQNGQQMDNSATLLLRIYTVTSDTKELVVVGNSVFDLFNSDRGIVRLGCYTRALRHGLPQISPDDITGHSLDKLPMIPASRIYFRIVKHSEVPELGPASLESEYMPVDGPMTESEMRIQMSYERDLEFPVTVRDAAVRLQQQESGRASAASLGADWMARRLDRSLHLPSDISPKDLELSRIVRYRKDVGLNVQVTGAYGLPEGYVVLCVANVVSSTETRAVADSDIHLLVSDFDLTSLQKSPKWLDKPSVIHPNADSDSYLVIRLYGVDVQYTPQRDHNAPGTVTRRGDQLPTSLEDVSLGWAAISLFQGSFVLTGEHHVPLFRNTEVLTNLPRGRPQSSFKALAPQLEKLGATLVVRLWDGHFTAGQLPQPLQLVRTSLLSVEEWTQEDVDRDGNQLSQFLLDGLTQMYPNLDVSSTIYEKERELFKMAVREAFQKLSSADAKHK